MQIIFIILYIFSIKIMESNKKTLLLSIIFYYFPGTSSNTLSLGIFPIDSLVYSPFTHFSI